MVHETRLAVKNGRVNFSGASIRAKIVGDFITLLIKCKGPDALIGMEHFGHPF